MGEELITHENNFETLDEGDAESLLFLKVEMDPDELRKLTEPELLTLIGELAAADAQVRLRLMEVFGKTAGKTDNGGDRLLTVAEAARKLACTKDYLYRNSRRLPFVVRNGRQLRFSERGIERYIRQRTV